MNPSHRLTSHTLAVLAWWVLGSAPGAFAAEIVERCEYGPAPDAPNFAAVLAERNRITAELGYEPVCDALLPSIDPSRASSATLAGIRDQLLFQPMPLDSSVLAGYRLLGATPSHATNRPDANAALHRYFAGADGELNDLLEWDLSLGGSVTHFGTGWQTLMVRGEPGVLAIFQSKSGKAVSSLMWERNRRFIQLMVNRNVNRSGLAEFTRLVESLPDPVPANPNEPLTPPDRPPNFPFNLAPSPGR